MLEALKKEPIKRPTSDHLKEVVNRKLDNYCRHMKSVSDSIAKNLSNEGNIGEVFEDQTIKHQSIISVLKKAIDDIEKIEG